MWGPLPSWAQMPLEEWCGSHSQVRVPVWSGVGRVGSLSSPPGESRAWCRGTRGLRGITRSYALWGGGLAVSPHNREYLVWVCQAHEAATPRSTQMTPSSSKAIDGASLEPFAKIPRQNPRVQDHFHGAHIFLFCRNFFFSF